MTPETALSTESRIHLGDCIEGMRSLETGCIDLAFADPPFNIGFKYDVYNDSLETDDYLRWSEDWIKEVHRVLKPSGTFWLAIGDEYAAELKVLSQRLGFQCRSWVIWYYTFGVNCKYKFTRSHAHLFHFVKDLNDCTFNDSDPAVRIPSARQLVYNDIRANSKGRLPDDTWILRPQDLPTGFTADEDVWYFPRVAGTFKERAGFHGCQMPEQLLGRIVRSCSNPGDLVMDPFSGSATTVTVAKKLGRRFLSFEMSQEYVELGTARLNRTCVGDPLDGTADPLRSAPATANGKALQSDKSPKTTGRVAKSRDSVNQTPSLFDQEPSTAIDESILEAYESVYEGFSVDRVLIDPVLSARFDAACIELKIAQTASQCRRTLLRLRTLGQLKSYGLDTSVVTHFPDSMLRRWSFAAEIGWRQMIDRYPSWGIDDWLTEPDAISQYDRIAGLHAPSLDAFQLRWTLLRWRDIRQTLTSRHKTQSSGSSEIGWAVATDLDKDSSTKLPHAPGVYQIGHNAQGAWVTLYVGMADDLSVRIDDHFSHPSVHNLWRTLASGDVMLRTAVVIEDDQREKCWFDCINTLPKPVWNV